MILHQHKFTHQTYLNHHINSAAIYVMSIVGVEMLVHDVECDFAVLKNRPPTILRERRAITPLLVFLSRYVLGKLTFSKIWASYFTRVSIVPQQGFRDNSYP